MKKNKKNIQEEAVLEDYKLDIGAKSAERSLNGHIEPTMKYLVLNESGTGVVHLDEKSMEKNSKFIVNTRLI